jgi:hypothetical protein
MVPMSNITGKLAETFLVHETKLSYFVTKFHFKNMVDVGKIVRHSTCPQKYYLGLYNNIFL